MVRLQYRIIYMVIWPFIGEYNHSYNHKYLYISLKSSHLYMIRSSQLNLKYTTASKRKSIDLLFDEYNSFLQKVINNLWNHHVEIKGCLVPKKYYQDIATNLTERYKQCAAKQAYASVKSARTLEGSKPIVKGNVLELDQRFVEIQDGNNSFDLWIKLRLLNRKSILLPTKKTKHYNDFVKSNWNRKKSIRLRKRKGKLYVDIVFEKENENLKDIGNDVGLDIGYRKLAVLSDHQIVGIDLRKDINQFIHRKTGHTTIKQNINRYVNSIDFTNIKTLVVEELKNVKKNQKGKKSKSTNRKLSYWAYRHALNKLQMLCEENRVRFAVVNPAYTSKVCNKCGSLGNRRAESFECQCGWKVDADYNAALNIRDRWLNCGVYSPVPVKTEREICL